MEANDAAEQLFLLEILIEKITFKKATLMRYYQTKNDACLPLAVNIKFCGLPPFEISQEDVRSPNSLDFGKVGEFNCGESCLFPMDASTLTRNIKRSPLQMTVTRKHRNDVPPDFLGTTQATLPENMIDTVTGVARSQQLPLSCAYEDTVNIRTQDNEDAGFLTLFVRLSCFGQSIITQFKLMKETKSFLFKSATADPPYICDELQTGEFPLDNRTKDEMCTEQGNTICGPNAALLGCLQCPGALPQSAPGEMLAFGDFGITIHRPSIQKSLYDLCSGYANIVTSSDIISFLKSCKMHIRHHLIVQNYMKCSVSKFCPQRVSKNVSKHFSGLVTVISPGRAPMLSTQHLRGGVCKGEEPSLRSKTVSFCGAGGNTGDFQRGHCSVATSVQRLCCCRGCTNTKDVTPPRYPTSGRSIQDVVPVTPIICTQDELIDPDMEQQLDAGALKTRKHEWQKVFCCCLGGSGELGDQEDTPEEGYKTTNPPIRYDTTGALTAAAGGKRPVPLGHLVVNANPEAINPPIRYNTTGALGRSPYMTPEGEYMAANPPIRYDTTGALTAVAGGLRPVPEGLLIINANPKAPNPPIRYDTTGALSRSDWKPKLTAEYQTANPPVRYDTTSALTDAADGRRPVPEGSVVVSANPDAPNPPIRYDTTGALSPAYVPITEKEVEELHKAEEGQEEEGEEEEETFVALCEEKDIGEMDATLAELFPQYFVPDSFLEQELECIIRKTQRGKKRSKTQTKSSKGLPFLPPGVLIGHRHCVEWEPNVPAKQGWLWNCINGICGLPFRPGWKPGAVRRSVALAMIKATMKRKPKKPVYIEKPLIPPTLHIVKKKGIYYITMRPMDIPVGDPTPPVTFRLPPLADGEVDELDVENMSSGSSDLEIEFCAPGTCPPDYPPKDFSVQCSLSQGLVATADSPKPRSKHKGKGKKKK